MKTCPQCRRHLFSSDERCPFCGCEQRETTASTAAASLLGLVIAAAGCGPALDDNPADSQGSASAGSDSGMEASTSGGDSITASGPTPTSTGSAENSTGAPPGTTSSGSTTTSSTTDESSTSSPTDPSASGGFLYGLPDMGPFEQFECSLIEQDCEDDEKCAAWANDGGNVLNATTCRPLDPDAAAIGNPCTYEGSLLSGIDSCGRDARCLGEEDGAANEGICVPLCTGSEEEPVCDDPQLECIYTEMEVLPVCITPCECEGEASCEAQLDGQGECVPAP